MWTKQELPTPQDQDEARDTAALKALLARESDAQTPLAPPYWGSLIARTNERIDAVTSAKALSISWAARVAIPGVLVILFFFIGLHYYAPDMGTNDATVAGLIETLPQPTVDSLMLNSDALRASLSTGDVGSDFFQFTGEQLSEYISTNASRETLVESLDDTDVTSLLVALDTRKNL
jgi:hypothetical protein